MEIFINTQGTAVKLSPQHVYQGTNVSQINLYAPFPSQTSLSVAFMLPDGTTTPYYPMTFTGITSDEAEGINLWQYVMPFAITQDAGAARVAFLATFNENGTAAQQTSAYVDFTIEQSALPVLPDEPTPDVWTQILSYLSAQDTKIAAIQSDVADIEQVADEANTNAGIALTTANEANTTATQAKTTADGIDGKATQALATSQTAEQTAHEAKTTADGLADSIAQANTTATQANVTAEEAKEIAEGAAQGNGTRVSVGGSFRQTLSFTSDPQTQIAQNASAVAATEQSITDIENGTTTVAKANEATKASQDANGNVIDKTYATKDELTDIENGTTPAGNANKLGGVDASGYMQVPSSVTNTLCASAQWAVSAAAGPGTYLIGTFNVYDSNIHLKISGGIVMNTVDDTTDAEVFISTTNYTVKKAVCFANKLYKTSTRTGLYYTIDSSHNLRIFAPMPDYGKLFISAEITGCTITGKGDGSIQSPSGGEYIKTNYYFATDPSALTPSTANGWTQTTATGSLPSSGVYLAIVNFTDGDSSNTPGIIFYSENYISSGTILGTATLLYYTPSNSEKWDLRSLSGSPIQVNNVYYKRIA